MLTSSPATGSDTWLSRLSERAGGHAHLTGVDHTGLDPTTAGLLGPSLAIFQLGESGTGEHLFEAARRAGTDADYQACLERFIGEEQEHARLLALVLDGLGQPLRHRHWTDGAFVLIRRAHSLRTEILVLMVAEVVALSYYGALADGVTSPGLAEIFGRIHGDEEVHVAFHSDTLPHQLRRFPRPIHTLSRVLWSTLVLGAALVVAKDHGRLLAHVGVPRRRFLRQVLADHGRIGAALFRR